MPSFVHFDGSYAPRNQSATGAFIVVMISRKSPRVLMQEAAFCVQPEHSHVAEAEALIGCLSGICRIDDNVQELRD